MTPVDDRALAGRIENALREIPEVAALYAAGPLVSRLRDTVVDALRSDTANRSASVQIERDERDRVRVSVSVGVSAADAVPATAQRIHDVIQQVLGRSDGDIRVTIARVDESTRKPPSDGEG